MSPSLVPGTGLNELTVTVVGTTPESGRVMVRDAFGNEFEVDGSIGNKGGGRPMPGEQWIITRRGGLWVPDLMLALPATPVITGDRAGLPEVVNQVLDALVEHGIVADATTVDPATGYVPPEPPTEVDPDEALEPREPVIWDEDVPPDSVTPSPTPPPGPDPKEDPISEPERPTSQFSSLYIVTYNMLHELSLRTVRRDLQRLSRTPAQIICLQEMMSDTRLTVLNDMTEWDYWRPDAQAGQGQVPIMWRKDDFVLLDKGARHLSDRTFVGKEGAGLETLQQKWGVWVKLLHKASGQTVFMVNAHLAPSVEGGGGRPTRDPDLQRRLPLHRAQVSGLAEMIRDFSRNGRLVFVAADFNVNFRKDSRARHRHFPYAAFSRVRARANWAFERPLTDAGTHGRRLIDYVVHRLSPSIRHVESRILSGYHSDHRPVLVRYKIVRRR